MNTTNSRKKKNCHWQYSIIKHKILPPFFLPGKQRFPSTRKPKQSHIHMPPLCVYVCTLCVSSGFSLHIGILSISWPLCPSGPRMTGGLTRLPATITSACGNLATAGQTLSIKTKDKTKRVPQRFLGLDLTRAWLALEPLVSDFWDLDEAWRIFEGSQVYQLCHRIVFAEPFITDVNIIYIHINTYNLRSQSIFSFSTNEDLVRAAASEFVPLSKILRINSSTYGVTIEPCCYISPTSLCVASTGTHKWLISFPPCLYQAERTPERAVLLKCHKM